MGEKSRRETCAAKIDELIPRRSIFPWIDKKIEISPSQENGAYFLKTIRDDGSVELRLIQKPESFPPSPGLQGIFISFEDQPMALEFSRCKTDDKGNSFDFFVSGDWKVIDGRTFALSRLCSVLRPGHSLSSEMAGSMIGQMAAEKVRDVVREYSVNDLRERNALPKPWWEKKFNDWMGECGIAIRLQETTWRSATAEAAEAESARLRDLQRIAVSVEAEAEALKRAAEAKSRREQCLREIESDDRLDEMSRRHQIVIAEKKYILELLEADRDIEKAKREGEKAALEHELTLSSLRKDIARAKRLESLESEVAGRYQKAIEEIEDAANKIGNLPDDILDQIISRRQSASAFQTIEKLISPEYEIPVWVFSRLGVRLERQFLVQTFREKGVADEMIHIDMQETVSRDISHKKVKALSIASSLRFKFAARKSGFVTIFNIGTSGDVFLHVPNPFVPPSKARIESERSYFIPGPELLPSERIEGYFEVGPPGWEHLAVVISASPLISRDDLAEASDREPFVVIPNREILRILRELKAQGSENWSAAVLSFLVE